MYKKPKYTLPLGISHTKPCNKVSSKVKLEEGFKYISIKPQNKDTSETVGYFSLNITNHRFNGYMDYFYLGNHTTSGGLLDTHLNANVLIGEESTITASILNIFGSEELPSEEKDLETKLDLIFSHKFKEFYGAAGYSQMFTPDGM